MTRIALNSILAISAVSLGTGRLPAQPADSEAAVFRQSIKLRRDALHLAGKEFGQKLNAAYSTGNEADIAAMKAAHDEALKSVTRIEEEWPCIKTPTGKFGRELHEVFGRYLTRERKAIQTDVLQMIHIIENPALSHDEKTRRLQATIESNQRSEKEAEFALDKVLKAFCDEHQIK